MYTPCNVISKNQQVSPTERMRDSTLLSFRMRGLSSKMRCKNDAGL